jgi:hypothetical protein
MGEPPISLVDVAARAVADASVAPLERADYVETRAPTERFGPFYLSSKRGT